MISTTAFWLVMTSLLIRREFFELTAVETPYEVLPLHNVQLREEYRAIYLGNQFIGFNFNTLEAQGESEKPDYELRHQNYLTFRFLGEEREMLVKGKALLNSRLYLKGFEVRITSGDHWNRITGQIAKNNLNLIIEGKNSAPERKIIALQGPILFSEAMNFVWTPENLKIGKQGRLELWNPLLMNTEVIGFRVNGKEKINYQGKDLTAYIVRIKQDNVETRMWVGEDGIVLRQESPTGLVMEKEDTWKIFDAMRRERTDLPDLPNLYSIPSNQILKNPEALHRLRAKINTPNAEKDIILEKIDLDKIENISWPIQGEESNPYLAPTPWIQSQDPSILKTARQLAGEEKSALRASLKILQWVHKNVSPVPTVTIPSAVQVLQSRRGDCNEYTALFTALTRALGIPTKMMAGLVYQEGRFFYHAWPEIFIGKWVPLDPTFGQAPADLTHIPIVEGDIEEQVGLVREIGKIKVTILEAK
ncbi:MAG: transglutaminase domain-containing protein [Candidatus Omnitrophica bacterium]|nr:transglutaminase domain-containing protein [Candidatus Omnitrophota bacterium]